MVVYAVRVHFECQVRLSTMAEASMAGVKQVSFSSYYYGLEESGKSRYRDKLAILGGIADPYLSMELDQENVDWQDWPEVEYPDIFNYLINTPSPYTMKELKAYKSLEGYRQFIDGWVSNINVSILSSDKFLVTARVKHSQRLCIPPANCDLRLLSSDLSCQNQQGNGRTGVHSLCEIDWSIPRHSSTFPSSEVTARTVKPPL